jgi:hypothetical protein
MGLAALRASSIFKSPQTTQRGQLSNAETLQAPTLILHLALSSRPAGIGGGLSKAVAQLKSQDRGSTLPNALYEYFLLPDGEYLEVARPAPLEAFPEGTIPVDQKPGEFAEFDAKKKKWVDKTPPAVILERQRSAMTCTAMQFRVALLRAGKQKAWQTAVNSADDETKILWEYGTDWHRTMPKIIAIAEAAKLTEEELDELFTAAMGIKLW